MSPQSIIDLIDAGLGHSSSVAAAIDQTRCCRQDCKRHADDGHDFCAPCLAWMRFEVDDDPLGDAAEPAPPKSSPPPVPGPLTGEVELDEWPAYFEAAIGNYI